MQKKNKKPAARKGKAHIVHANLPYMKLLTRMKGDQARREVLRAAGPQLGDSICSVCKNIHLETIKPKRTLTQKQKKLVQQLAEGGPAARRKLEQKGGLFPILPLLASALPLVGSLFKKVLG